MTTPNNSGDPGVAHAPHTPQTDYYADVNGRREYVQEVFDQTAPHYDRIERRNIIAKYAFTPLDVERKLINMRGGDHCVGASTRDQMLENRPFPGLAPYRTPIERLFLCGSGTHPFGNITGAPGYNAARVICEELKIKPWWTPPDPRSLWEEMA